MPAGPRASKSPASVSTPSGLPPSGKCLFSLLNLPNTNTVNFISEGCSCWIQYEPPVSSPKPPLCLPVCVYAHTSTHVLTNQHIGKCLCMQSEGNAPPPSLLSTTSVHKSPSAAFTLKSFSPSLADIYFGSCFCHGSFPQAALIFLCPPSPYIPTQSCTNSLLNASQCETPQCDFSYS